MLDAVSKELKDFVLDFVVVNVGLLTHSKMSWHLKLPLDLV